jgi:hypothetical protein
MTFRDFVPHWGIAIFFGVFWLSDDASILPFEDSFRNRVRTQISEIIFEGKGPQFAKLLFGADTWFGLLANVTYCLSLPFLIAFPIAYGYDNGWRRAVGLLLVAFTLRAVYALCVVLLGVDESNRVLAAAATLLTAAIMLGLAFQVTWFHFLGGPLHDS